MWYPLRFVFIGFSLLCFFVGAAQTKKIDSLKKAFWLAVDSRQKLNLLQQLLEQRNSLNLDTLYAYAQQMNTMAVIVGDAQAVSDAQQDIALYLAGKKRLDTALQIVSAELKKTTVTQNAALHLPLLLSHARLLYRNNQYKEALEKLFSVLNIAEKTADISYQVMAKTGIGWLQLDMKEYNDALRWFYDALNTPGSNAYLPAYSALYSNLATTHQALGRPDSALHYIRKAIGNARQNETLNYLATSLRIYADILLGQKNYRQAEEAMEEMVQIRKLSDGSFFVNYDMSLLAHLYAQTGQSQKGIALCKNVIDSALNSGITTQLYLVYDALAANYKAAGEYKAYGETLEKSRAFQDSLTRMNTGQLIAGLQSQYMMQKKENLIMQQKLDIVQKKILLYGLMALVLFAGILAAVLFRQYRKRQNFKLQLLREDEKRKAAKAVLDAGEAERKRIAADLHDSLGAYAASIASNIQQLEETADSRTNGTFQELRANSQAIVSQLSDTIWVLKKDALLLTSISDRIKLFIQKIAPSHPQVTIDVCEEIKCDHLLPPAQAFHLFQIIKEAISNALRHSRCTVIQVHVKAAEGWDVSITDNGRGLYRQTLLAEGGNGMHNMKQRAEESGWKIEWKANKPAGTKVMIEPVTN